MEGDAASVTLRDVLTDDVLSRSSWERRKVTYPEIEKLRAAWIDQYGQVFVGGHSISVPETKTKLIAYDEWPVTSGELGRAYLRRVFCGVKRPLCSPRATGFAWEAPIVCRPVKHRHLAYVDVRSAYWQLVSVFRPDDLVLGDEIVEGETDWLTVDQVESDRRLRHAVVGSLFASKLSYYRYGNLVTVPKASRWSNPSLKRVCMQTLHAVCGRLSRDVGVHAWLTDAAIVDADDAEPMRRWLEREWSISSRTVASGAGAVISATTYAVGDKQSLDLVHETTTLARAEERPFTSLRRVPGRQLHRVRMEALA